MHFKTTLILALIIMTPLSALGWLGLRNTANEQQLLASQFTALVNAQLTSVNQQIMQYFTNKAQQYLNTIEQLTLEKNTLRAAITRLADVRQLFIMNQEGRRIFPPIDDSLTNKENVFLQRTKHIWRDKTILYETENHDNQALEKTEGHRTHGWYVWHNNNEINHIFWYKNNAKQLVGIELFPARIAADIIALLPITSVLNATKNPQRITLVNDRGSTVYQWGHYTPDLQESSVALLPLNHPLGSWRLEYFGNFEQRYSALSQWNLLLGLSLLAIVLCALAIYLYRIHTREIRLASQRVTFVNQVSHELKTPLTNIRLYAELLEYELSDIEETAPQQYLSIITSECQRLSRLITNVLNFSQTQRQQLKLRYSHCVVDDIVNHVITGYKAAFDAKNMRITFTANAKQLVYLDKDVCEQILYNLLNNAEKYASIGQQVDIETEQDAITTTLMVRDYGPGIPIDEMNRIFDPFYRIHSNLTEGVSGTGIGLSITKELARLHQGSLIIVSVPQGACFKVNLTTPTNDPFYENTDR